MHAKLHVHVSSVTSCLNVGRSHHPCPYFGYESTDVSGETALIFAGGPAISTNYFYWPTYRTFSRSCENDMGTRVAGINYYWLGKGLRYDRYRNAYVTGRAEFVCML